MLRRDGEFVKNEVIDALLPGKPSKHRYSRTVL